MKLELDEYEVLALYDHLMESRYERPSSDVSNIRDRLRDHIIQSLLPRKSSCEGCYEKSDAALFDPKEEMLGVWEQSVMERLEEKASETSPENRVFDLLEEYDSQYPKSFRKSRSSRRKNKK